MCRTGCPTQDHESWGECARAANIKTGVIDLTAQKRGDGALDLYAAARKQGIQPSSTRLADVRRALDNSDKAGTAFRGA